MCLSGVQFTICFEFKLVFGESGATGCYAGRYASSGTTVPLPVLTDQWPGTRGKGTSIDRWVSLVLSTRWLRCVLILLWNKANVAPLAVTLGVTAAAARFLRHLFLQSVPCGKGIATNACVYERLLSAFSRRV